jgi:hypothetical protein
MGLATNHCGDMRMSLCYRQLGRGLIRRLLLRRIARCTSPPTKSPYVEAA